MILFLKSIEKNEIEITSSFRVLDKYNVLFHPTLILVFGEENEEINDFNSIEDINKKNEFNNISIKNIRFVHYKKMKFIFWNYSKISFTFLLL